MKTAAEKEEKEEKKNSPPGAKDTTTAQEEKVKEPVTFDSIYEDNRSRIERYAGQIRRRKQSRLEIHDYHQQFLKNNSELVAGMGTALKEQSKAKKIDNTTWNSYILPHRDYSDDRDKTPQDSAVSAVAETSPEQLISSLPTELTESPNTPIPTPMSAQAPEALEISASAPQQVFAVYDLSAPQSTTVFDIIGVADTT